MEKKTTKDHLVDALDDLGSENLKKFKSKLCDRKEEPRLRRSAVEKVQYTVDLADLLTSTFTVKKAVPVAVEVLRAIGCHQVAEDLDQATECSCPAPQPQMGDNTVPTPQGSGGTPGPPARGYDQPDTSSVLIPSTPQFKQAIISEKGREIYQVLEKGVRKRLALLINNVDFKCKNMKRNGAQKDKEYMEKLLRGLGYDVVAHTNLSGQEMDEAIRSFAGRSEHAESDSTFVVIMSHGKRDAILGVHYGPDNDKDFLPVDNIYTHLNTANCPALRDKPKVILIQACRGGEDGSTWVADSGPDEQWNMESDTFEHKEKDFISLLSCTPDTKSYRHKLKGSLFIGFLVQVFNARAHQDHVEELFRQVMRCFEDFGMLKQMVCKDRTTLLKNFYLFPGL
ncbi:caspase a-like [Salminus brasiliensis]|uniref:caspase a-like n=1 Tax=Salminus brasiliensis TaxID=930266 RepID=UPI003B833D2D